MNNPESAQERRTGGKSRVSAMVCAENRDGHSRTITEGASHLRWLRAFRGLLLAAFMAYAALILYAWPDLVAWRNGEPPVMIGGER